MQDMQTDLEGIWKFLVQTFTVVCSLICHSQPLHCLQGLKNPWTEAVISLLTLYQCFAIPIACQFSPGVWYLSLAFFSLALSQLCKWEHVFLMLLRPGKSCFERTGKESTEEDCSEELNGRHFQDRGIDNAEKSVKDVEQGTGSNERKMRGNEHMFETLELVRHSCQKLMVTQFSCSTTGGCCHCCFSVSAEEQLQGFFQLVPKIQCKLPKLLQVHTSVFCVSSPAWLVFYLPGKLKECSKSYQETH